MPNDMSKEQAAAQRKHADGIKAERAISNFLGISRSQARELRTTFFKESNARADAKAISGSSSPTPPTLPGPQHSTKFDVQPVSKTLGDGARGIISNGTISGVTMVVVNPDTSFVETYTDCTINGSLGTLLT